MAHCSQKHARTLHFKFSPWSLKDIVTIWCHQRLILQCHGSLNSRILLLCFNISNGRKPQLLNLLNSFLNMEQPSPHIFVVLKLTLSWYHATTGDLSWAGIHQGTILEYNFYVESCNCLLHHPHVCAALLEGSIIWHLTIDGLGAHSESIVLDGPSWEVLQHGHALKCDSNKNNWLWDDTLSDHDRDVICGIYKVYTSQFVSLCIS